MTNGGGGSNGCTVCGVFTSVTGITPNRVFNIEYRTRIYGASSSSINFEIRLHEEQGLLGESFFDIFYDVMNETGGDGATVGVQTLVGTTRYTQYGGCVTGPTTGTRLHFGQPLCTTPTPTDTPTTAATNTDTPAVTNTPTDTATNTPVVNTNTPTDTATNTPTNTATNTDTPVVNTNTPTNTPTNTLSPTLTRTATNTPTNTFTATATPTAQCLDYLISEDVSTWVSATNEITASTAHTDDGVTTIALPFAASFYGTSFSSATISTNGDLQFSSTN